MKKKSWLRKDIPLLKKSELSYFIVLIILPNIIFWMLAIYTGTSRPVLNIDYLFVLFALLIHQSIIRFLGVIFLVIALLFDILMLIVQIFPFMDLTAIQYLWKFIWMAPIRFIFIIIFFVIIIVMLIYLNLFLSKKVFSINRIFINLTFFSLIVSVAYILMQSKITYQKFNGIIGRNNYYIVHSQALLYGEISNSEFAQLMSLNPELKPLENQEYAAKKILSPYSDKILYIIAESWGGLKNSDAQSLILKNILDNKAKFDFIEIGSLRATGATVAAELRELCSLELVNNGFALSRLDKSHYSNCLPKKLGQQGYRTIALHGTSGLLYDRNDWYVKAGFQKILFGENFLNLKRCAPFKGVCDSELIKEISNILTKNRDEKLFIYWMTLTSHQPYAKDDIYNYRFDCSKFSINPKGDACRNAQLNTQFFDDLVRLIERPEMQGVEVIVVGDHQPPMLTEEDMEPINPLRVSYLHFKIK
ncbi:sulfatase-like hydrolase/transferase [Acinetobacter lwoffii]|uniref:sulfatase-like hydrolase/transferase n=1 Tax=Acinetobacter lwoffii TaxID=28090 RepID=UPI00209BA7C9|nr:sulfatase-like hydrolase/transferase [Acinetobacter lwoffii]MCO8078544.1 sulfatase-like hydrolase/transferase [Acinetobacter lwoffii]